MVGNRRQGKSVLCNHLVQELLTQKQFGLVVSFMGSSHCNPALNACLSTHGFGRFQFNAWDNEFMERLEQQQLELMAVGKARHVLLVLDDVTLNWHDREKLSHLCIRGRHFYVSVIMLSVSYSSFPKSCRRSTDFIFLFSLGCQSDRELLLKEFAHRQSTAEFYLQKITSKEHTCAVLNLNEKRQTMYWYKAPTPAAPAYCQRKTRTPETSTTPPQPDVCGTNTTSLYRSTDRTTDFATRPQGPVSSAVC